MKESSMQIETHATLQQIQTERGVRFCQNFSIANRDSESNPSAIYFWLEVTDPNFFSLLDWHSFTPASPTALEAGETRDIALNFDVPAHAAPGVYHYTIAYKSDQNLEKTVRYPLQLEIPSIQPQRFKKTLNFTLDPATTSGHPYQLQPGHSISFKVKIQNRSTLSDLIYLNCSELPSDWFTIDYLSAEAAPLGIVQQVDGLRLESQESGEIHFIFHPPLGTPAESYFPTLQLISMNAPDLVTLDVIYVQVLPDERITAELTPKTRSIPREPATFALTLHNQGNVDRTLKIDPRDSERQFRFVTTLPNNTVTIAAGKELSIALKAVPRKKWQRPLWGKPIRSSVSFNLVSIAPPAARTVPDPLQAKLLWLPQPKWVLAGLMLFGAGALLALLSALYRFNRPPMAIADILTFSPTKRTYLEGASNAVRLNWTVRNPENISRIAIAQLNEGAEIQTKEYTFSPSIPQELQAKTKQDNGCRRLASALPAQTAPTFWELPLPNLPWFSSLQQAPSFTTIECQGIPFVSSQAGIFKYKLKLFASDVLPIAEQTTETVTVKSTGSSQSPEQAAMFIPRSNAAQSQPPQILSFTLNGQNALSQLTHTFSVARTDVANITVSWQVQGDEGLEVELLPFSGSVRSRGSITYRIAPGNLQTLTLTARNQAGEQVTQSIDIQVVAAEPLRPSRNPVRQATPPPEPTPPDPTETPTPSETPSPSPDPSASPTPSPETLPPSAP